MAAYLVKLKNNFTCTLQTCCGRANLTTGTRHRVRN